MTTEDSVTELRRAALNNPRNGEIRYLLGAELAQQRDYDGAVLEMTAALALEPALHVARLQLGLLHLTRGETHHSLEVWAPLEQLEDSSPLKHFKHGLEALIRDEFDPCIQQLEAGIKLNTSNAPLNHDMQMLIGKVREVQAANEAAAAKIVVAPNAAIDIKPASGDDPSRVHTDFSLYNQQIKH